MEYADDVMVVSEDVGVSSIFETICLGYVFTCEVEISVARKDWFESEP